MGQIWKVQIWYLKQVLFSILIFSLKAKKLYLKIERFVKKMFDPYYETKVNPKWSNSKIGSFLGSLLTVIGAAMVIFSIVDLSRGVSSNNGSAWQENSIWPTIGKGIWVGAFVSPKSNFFFASQKFKIVYKQSWSEQELLVLFRASNEPKSA